MNGNESRPELLRGTEQWEWETVEDESATTVVFDTIGDVFIGLYIGDEEITPDNGEKFERFLFRGQDNVRYAINKSYKLDGAFRNIEEGIWVRITYVADIPTGRKQNPMKDFRIDVRRSA